MDILHFHSFPGRNIYSHRPVIRSIIDLGGLYDTPTKEIDNFNNNLLGLFPGIKDHYCSSGYEGGFAERLGEGTYLAHVTEHLILELQTMVGYPVRHGKSRVLDNPSIYYIVFEYMNEKCAIECLITAVHIVNALICNTLPDMDGIMTHLRKVAAETELGPSTKAIFDEARRRKIPVSCLGDGSILQLGYGKNLRLMEASLTDTPSCISVDMAGDKHLTKQILAYNDIPVPYGDIAYTGQAAGEAAAYMGYPVVIKPFDANQGKGVTLNISQRDEVDAAFKEAIRYSRAVIVEKYIKGSDYRVLVVGDRVAAVAERTPPYVTGDGMHTVNELVDIENQNPLRGDDHEKPLTKIKLDHTARQVLLKNGMDESHIPAAGKTVYLRYNGNLSTGGTARDCTDEIHPYNRKLAVKAARLLGLDIAGVDITAEDISQPISNGSGAVIEVNTAPGLRMHLYPTAGNPRNVAADIIDMIYPEGKSNTVPIISITGTNGKTTSTRLVSHILALTGKTVGMASTSGVYIGGRCVLKGDNTGPASARMVLSNKMTEAAVLETARGGIIRKGLGYDLADVGVIVNISEDHLGIDGIQTVEDLAMVKSLVVEAVKDDGYAVLNADDKMTPFLLGRIRCNVVLFSRDRKNPLVRDFVKAGGSAVIVRDNSIYICCEEGELPVAGLEEIPITFGGVAECNIENSLAAVSALFALSIPISIIKAGLLTFKPDIETNPGRFNIFDMGNFKVMLDYGHNPAGYRAVVNCISRIGAVRYVGIIGMPGDRTDKSIRDVGMLCGGAFSQVYIKEDNDLRGRNPGEVADILYESVISAGLRKECVDVVYSEVKALETAMLDAQPGDLIVLFYEEFEPLLELLEKFRRETAQVKLLNEAEEAEQVVV